MELSDLLEKQIARVTSFGLGIFQQYCSVTGQQQRNSLKGGINDSFVLSVPYCGKKLIWEVLFDVTDLTAPPDFIFDSDFMDYLSLSIIRKNVVSLFSWDIKEETSLMRIIKEFHDLYRTYSVENLSPHSRIQFEYVSLIEQLSAGSSDIEVFFDKDGATFMIRLPIDFSDTSSFLREHHNVLVAALNVDFHSMDASKTTTKVMSSRAASRVLPDNEFPTIPPFSQNKCLIDYVPAIQRLLEKCIKNKREEFLLRRALLVQILEVFGRNVLEFDAESYRNISLLFEWNDFHFITRIGVPSEYPGIKPLLLLQSVYHIHNKQPFSMEIPDYPYSSDWTDSQIVEEIHQSVLNSVVKFQKLSLKCSI